MFLSTSCILFWTFCPRARILRPFCNCACQISLDQNGLIAFDLRRAKISGPSPVVGYHPRHLCWPMPIWIYHQLPEVTLPLHRCSRAFHRELWLVIYFLIIYLSLSNTTWLNGHVYLITISILEANLLDGRYDSDLFKLGSGGWSLLF